MCKIVAKMFGKVKNIVKHTYTQELARQYGYFILKL